MHLLALLLACSPKPGADTGAASPVETADAGGDGGDGAVDTADDSGDSGDTAVGDSGDTAGDADASTPCPVVGGFERFVTRDGDRLMDGEQELRFFSFNVPNLHVLEDPYWHLPQPWEQEDALCSVAQLGGQVARTYVLSVGDSGAELPRHVTAPGVFSEELYVALDHALAAANRYGVRLIIPLVDQWSWWGGIEQYAAFRGKEAEEFWTDAQLREDFLLTVEHLLTRTNTVTGQRYIDDKAILAWETGNELDAPTEWTAVVAAAIKDLDPNHLVMDGRYGVDPDSLVNPDVDIVSNHYYWPDGYGEDIASAAADDRALSAGARPFVVGEFGLIGTHRYEDLLEVVLDQDIAGAMIWSLRYRDAGGGFYWHTEIEEPGYLVRAYHWPGFDSGDAYDERGVLALMREGAYAVRGLAPPPIEPPLPPELFEVSDVSAISWRAATGSGWFVLERAPDAAGPWSVVAEGFHDAVAPNEALVSDDTAVSGESYFYRLSACNEGGCSEPGAVEGPVTAVVVSELVDELDDLSLITERSDGIGLDTSNPVYFGGDGSRLYRAAAGEQWARYTVDGVVTGFEVEVWFWPNEERGQVVFSTGGESLVEVEASAIELGGDWEKVIYSAEGLAWGDTWQLTLADHEGEVWNPQVGRVTLTWE